MPDAGLLQSVREWSRQIGLGVSYELIISHCDLNAEPGEPLRDVSALFERYPDSLQRAEGEGRGGGHAVPRHQLELKLLDDVGE